MGAVAPPAPLHHYHAAKGGVLSFTYNLAQELALFNITVNCILPGPTRTPMWMSSHGDVEDIEAFFNNLGKSVVPMQRMGTPEDVAGAALFLASELSSYITGDRLYVSGGMPLPPNKA